MDKKMQNLYFKMIEFMIENEFCPKVCLSTPDEINSEECCVECVSEYIISSGKFTPDEINSILGD